MVKNLYVYTPEEIEQMKALLNSAKCILEGDSNLKIPACLGAINMVLREIEGEDDD